MASNISNIQTGASIVKVAESLDSSARRTVDIKTALPSAYSSLTADNFYAKIIKVSNSRESSKKGDTTEGFIYSYDPSTGTLITGKNITSVTIQSSYWYGNAKVTFDLYCIY